MSPFTLFIWSLLAGAILAIGLLAAVRAIGASRSKGARRNLLFVTLVGGALVIHTDLLPAVFGWPSDSAQAWMKLFAGPLVTGITLSNAGSWFAGGRRDRMIGILTRRTGGVLVGVAILLAVAGITRSPQTLQAWLWITAAINMAGVLASVAAGLRGAYLGDPLARLMTGSFVAATVTVAGIYAYSLKLPGIGPGAITLTVIAALVFIIMTSILVQQRNRDARRLAQLSQVDPSIEPATGMPIGLNLIKLVENEFWRVGRRNGRCAVVCLYLHNLYEPQESLDATAEYQVLVTMAARVSRAMGFRGIAGLYHPRCFAVAVNVEGDHQHPDILQQRLHAYGCEPMTVFRADGNPLRFQPQASFAQVLVEARDADAREILARSEAAARSAKPVLPQTEIDTIPGAALS